MPYVQVEAIIQILEAQLRLLVLRARLEAIIRIQEALLAFSAQLEVIIQILGVQALLFAQRAPLEVLVLTQGMEHVSSVPVEATTRSTERLRVSNAQLGVIIQTLEAQLCLLA